MGMSTHPARETFHTELYTYTTKDGLDIKVHTDPAGLWHAGVAATVWDCSLILSKHFEKLFEDRQRAHTVETQSTAHMYELLEQKSLNVLELGAGCSALPSLILASLRSDPHKYTNAFTLTDKSPALPLLSKSIEDLPERLARSLLIAELDWTNPSTQASAESTPDLIIASDLLAFPDHYPFLVNALLNRSSANTVVYIAYERRDFVAEIEFFKLLGEHFKFEMVPISELDDVWQAPGEIYLYRATRK